MNKDWLLKHTEQHLNKFRLASFKPCSSFQCLLSQSYSTTILHFVQFLTSRAQFSKSMKIPSSYSYIIIVKEPPKPSYIAI